MNDSNLSSRAPRDSAMNQSPASTSAPLTATEQQTDSHHKGLSVCALRAGTAVSAVPHTARCFPRASKLFSPGALWLHLVIGTSWHQGGVPTLSPRPSAQSHPTPSHSRMPTIVQTVRSRRCCLCVLRMRLSASSHGASRFETYNHVQSPVSDQQRQLDKSNGNATI